MRRRQGPQLPSTTSCRIQAAGWEVLSTVATAKQPPRSKLMVPDTLTQGATTLNTKLPRAVHHRLQRRRHDAGPFGAGATHADATTPTNDLHPTHGRRHPHGFQSRCRSLNFGFTVGNASGDSTRTVTFTGPITFLAAGRTMTDNFASGATLTLGSAATPSTITLPSGVAQTSIPIAHGRGPYPRSRFKTPTAANAGTLTLSTNTGNWTFNGPINGDGTLAITAASNVTLNGVKNAGWADPAAGARSRFNAIKYLPPAAALISLAPAQ